MGAASGSGAKAVSPIGSDGLSLFAYVHPESLRKRYEILGVGFCHQGLCRHLLQERGGYPSCCISSLEYFGQMKCEQP